MIMMIFINDKHWHTVWEDAGAKKKYFDTIVKRFCVCIGNCCLH